ncbi:hypothetical protein N9423_02095 [Alphaproteobacteria bacterium]|nr:hypothetical protein [Alphaproteobacteria bacterium]
MKRYLLNIILLLFIILCFGLPLANWGAFVTILVALYAIFLNKINTKPIMWLISCILLASLFIVKSQIYPPNVEMGEQIYSPEDIYLKNILPEDITNMAKNEWGSLKQPFDSYPANTEKTENPWAFSADAFFDNPQMSRTIKSLNFKDRYSLRIGTLNNAKYNYFGSDLGSSGAYYPLIFSFILPNTMASEKLCWTGKLYIEDNERWQEYFTQNKKCMTLDKEQWGKDKYLKIYAFDFNKNIPLSITTKNYRQTLIYILSILNAIIILLLLTKLNREDLTLVALSVISILLYMADQHYRGGHPSSFSGLPYMGRGNDGLTHYSYAREMVESLSHHDIIGWLRGNENIFYMMPGMRYLLGMTMPFFGESIFGLLLIISLTPITIRSLLKKLFNKKWQIIMLICFFIIPIFEAFGFYQIYLAKYTIEGFGAGIAISTLIAAFALLWKRDNIIYTNRDLLIIGFLLAVAISLRPNFLPFVAALFTGLSLYFIYNKRIQKVIALGIGFSPILLITYHNYFFGNVFVPLTNSATIGNNMRNGPEKWNNCLSSLSDSCNQVIHHLSIWVSYTEPWYIIILLCLIFIIFNKKMNIIEKLLAVSLIAGHLVFLFYEGVARYSHGIWLLSFILCLPVLKNKLKYFYKNNIMSPQR